MSLIPSSRLDCLRPAQGHSFSGRRRRGTRQTLYLSHLPLIIPHFFLEVAQARHRPLQLLQLIVLIFTTPLRASAYIIRPNNKMKTSQIFTSLYLAQAALAAPILLVAGSSAKAVFIRPTHQMTLQETVQIVMGDKHAPKPSGTGKATPASALDTDGPMTTAELMALSHTSGASSSSTPSKQRLKDASTQPVIPMTTTTVSSNIKGKVSVGTLVVPSGTAKTVLSQLFDPKVPRPYLVPGYYVAAQRADYFAVGIILAFVFAIVALETCGPLFRAYVLHQDPIYLYANDKTRALTRFYFSVSSLFQRQGSIRLDDESKNDRKVAVVEDEDDDEDYDDMAPFGGSPRPSVSAPGFELSEKVDEKAGWI